MSYYFSFQDSWGLPLALVGTRGPLDRVVLVRSTEYTEYKLVYYIYDIAQGNGLLLNTSNGSKFLLEGQNYWYSRRYPKVIKYVEPTSLLCSIQLLTGSYVVRYFALNGAILPREVCESLKPQS